MEVGGHCYQHGLGVERDQLSDGAAEQHLIVEAHQQNTIDWWTKREEFELFLSEAVLAEVRRGDPEAVKRRLAAAADAQILSATEEAQRLASEFLVTAAVPKKAAMSTRRRHD